MNRFSQRVALRFLSREAQDDADFGYTNSELIESIRNPYRMMMAELYALNKNTESMPVLRKDRVLQKLLKDMVLGGIAIHKHLTSKYPTDDKDFEYD